MPSRELTYRVSIDTSSARREAASLRSAFENELKSISVGKLDASGLKAVASDASAAKAEVAGLANEADKLDKKKLSLGEQIGKNFVSDIKGIALGFVGLQAAIGGFNKVIEIAQLGTQAARAAKSFEILSGGAEKAQINIIAIQRASKGTIDTLSAMAIGNQIAALNLASSAKDYERLVNVAKLISTASPSIRDMGDALAQLALFSSNVASFARSDQLLVGKAEVQDRMKELMAANGNLTDSQAKLEATMQLVEEKLGAVSTTVEAQASGVERLTVAWTEFNIAAASGTGIVQRAADSLANGVNQMTVILTGTGAPLGLLIGNLERLQEETKAIEDADFVAKGLSFFTGGDINAGSKNIQIVADSLNSAIDAVEQNIPGAGQYLSQIQEIAVSVDQWNYATDEQIAKIQQINTELNTLITTGGKAQAAALSAEEAAAARAAQRSEAILALSDPAFEALSSAAGKSVGKLGVENATNLLKQQRELLNKTIDELIASSVADGDEIALRIAAAQQQAVQAFSDMAASIPEVDPSVTAGSFDTINQSMMALNQGFVDFLPSASAVRDELASLAEEVMFTGVVTDEQAAALQNYASVAAAIADETSMLSAVTDELGVSFLYANPEAAGLVDAMYSAQASYMSGSITAEAYAGMLSVLGQQLLILAQQAGVATGSILTLVQAQAGLAGKGAFQVGAARGNAVAARVSAQQDARDRQKAIREAEQAAKRAAQEQQRSAKKAGKELEDGAKKASRELKSALGKVEGLFGRSAVTEKDMLLSKGGVYQDKADEYLRRLQAEVEQNKDLFGDVDIETAKQSLRDLGVQVADDQKIAFQQFADAWESGLLFFDPANVEKYIDKAAVERELELQKKAEEGKNNIYRAFGVVIDEAVDEATSGASGGGGISVADMDFTPAVAAAIDDSPLFNGDPYLLNLDPVVDQNSIWDQIRMPANGGDSWNIPVKPVVYGPQPKLDAMTAPMAGMMGGFPSFNPTAMGFADLGQQTGGKVEITATLAPDAASTISSDLADQLAKEVETFKSQGGTIGDILLSGISESFNVIEGDQVVGTGVADSIVASIGAQLGAKMKTLKNVGKGAGEIVKAGIAENVGSTQWVDGEMVAPIATGMITAINTQIRSQSEAFKREGTTAGQLVMAGVSGGFGGAAGMNGEPSADLAMAMVTALNTQFQQNANFFYSSGQPVATSVMDGYKSMFGNSEGAPLVTPMVSAINQQIRIASESLKNQGATMAQYVQHGFATAFSGESFKAALIAVGESLYASIRIGLLSAANGGDLVESLGAKILADISAEVEQP